MTEKLSNVIPKYRRREGVSTISSVDRKKEFTMMKIGSKLRFCIKIVEMKRPGIINDAINVEKFIIYIGKTPNDEVI